MLQDDTSHDFGALGVALQRLAGLEDDLPRVAIVGDVSQSGLEDGTRADKLGAYLQRAGCEQAWVWCPRWTDHMQSRLAVAAHMVHVTFFNRAEALCQTAEGLGSAHVLMKLGSGDAVAGLKQALAPPSTSPPSPSTCPPSWTTSGCFKTRPARPVSSPSSRVGLRHRPGDVGRILEAQGVDGLAVAMRKKACGFGRQASKPGCSCSIRPHHLRHDAPPRVGA